MNTVCHSDWSLRFLFLLFVSDLIHTLFLFPLEMSLGMSSISKLLNYTLITKLQLYPWMRQCIFTFVNNSLCRCYRPSAGWEEPRGPLFVFPLPVFPVISFLSPLYSYWNPVRLLGHVSVLSSYSTQTHQVPAEYWAASWVWALMWHSVFIIF